MIRGNTYEKRIAEVLEVAAKVMELDLDECLQLARTSRGDIPRFRVHITVIQALMEARPKIASARDALLQMDLAAGRQKIHRLR